jgi:hypothetical protein
LHGKRQRAGRWATSVRTAQLHETQPSSVVGRVAGAIRDKDGQGAPAAWLTAQTRRDVLELDLDLGLQADAERLCALGELAADRVLVGGFGVVEDQRRGGEPRDRAALRVRSGCAVT